jgi:hypothetical protein
MGRIVDLADALAYGNLDETTLDGQMFDALLDAAEVFVERYCGRRFSPDPALAADGSDTLAPVSKSFAVSAGQASVRIPDLRVATTVTLNGMAITQADPYGGGGYTLDNYQDPATRVYLMAPSGLMGGSTLGTLWRGPGKLTITGRWGFAESPEPIALAVKALTMRMYRERDAAWADSVATPDGSVLSYFRQLPSSIQGLLQMYRSGPKIAFV